MGTIAMRIARAEDGRGGPAARAAAIAFDLPEQPLASALESYSVVSGWQVIYDANLATGRRSAHVKGEFLPAEALRVLLAGTGLTPRYMGSDGAMLVLDPSVAAAGTAADPASVYRGYYGRIQATLKHAFCADRQIRSGGWRIALGLWIGESGRIVHAAALDSTGSAEIDAAFDQAVRMLSIGDPPPAGFQQPVVVLVTPDLAGQCSTTAIGASPARAER